MKGESPYKAKIENSSAQGRGRGGYRGRGRVGDRGKGQFGDQHQSKSNFSVDIARNLVTRKHNVGANRETGPRKPTLQRKL